MNELNMDQLNLVSGGVASLTDIWVPYNGQPINEHGGGGRTPLMQSDGSNGDDPLPVYIPRFYP